jgi:NTE family protein
MTPPSSLPWTALPGPRSGVRGRLALVMGGGGARAAYQVGFLRCLARRHPDLRIPILTGVSAGAINAALLASHHGTFAQAVEELAGLWSTLKMENVFRVDTPSLAGHVARWGLHLVSGGILRGSHPRGLVDTSPLYRFLSEALHAVDGELTGIQANLARGRLEAVAITTSSYTTGRSVIWIQGADVEGWDRPLREARATTLSVEHIMASAALPLFFPAIRIEDQYYGDGGIRQPAPLSPAVHLGADRIMAISTRSDDGPAEGAGSGGEPMVAGYPPPAQVAGVLLNAIFLDLLDQDVHRLHRLNGLLQELPPERRRGLRPVRLLSLRPSLDLGRLAYRYEPQLPMAFRFLTRGLGTRETASPDALSLVLFQTDYICRLMDQGEADAEDRIHEIEAFLSGQD